jgi:dihydroxy-acid dehydratase
VVPVAPVTKTTPGPVIGVAVLVLTDANLHGRDATRLPQSSSRCTLRPMSATGPSGIDGRPTSYGDAGFSRFLRRAFVASTGADDETLERPIIGVVDTTSDYVTCHREMPQLIEALKRGITEAGGTPMVFPTMSLGEILTNPTTMLFRNLMAMVIEEQLLSQPMDAVVLLGGCDKTVPAELMAAVSADVPAIALVVGPMMTGSWRGERLGACTDCRHSWGEFRAGRLKESELTELSDELCPTAGTCMVMGTASTMACLAEALGVMLPRAASAPSVSAERLRSGAATGRQAVRLAFEGRRPSDVLTRASYLNALTVLAAISGSTNAVIHLTAIARRGGVALTLEDVHEISARTPLLVDVKPAGSAYMEDFHRAGGMPVLMKTLAPLLDLGALTVTGQTLGEVLEDVKPPQDWQNVIARLDRPRGPTGSLVTLTGNLASEGAVLKAAAASPSLFHHRGPAVVFDSPEDVAANIDDPARGITADSVLVLRGMGPVGAGMPETGSAPIPRYLAAQGVRDMVRISDGRMSGTAYGTVILHCSPEAAAGGALGLVRDGDLIQLDVAARRVDVLVSDDELERRRLDVKLPLPPARGWRKLYAERVLQADQGADLDFLV